MKKMDFVYFDGEFVRGEKSDFDCRKNPRGVFETMRSYGGCILALESHVKRLRGGCIFLGVKPPAAHRLKAAILSLLKKNHIKDARIRLTAMAQGTCFRVCLSVFKLSGRMRRVQGYRVVVINHPRRNGTVSSRVKSVNREFYERLYRRAQRTGYDEAVFLNTQGVVVEGTRTNVFIVKNGRLRTPALGVGCLPGITRSIVFELAKHNAITVRRGCFYVDDLLRADEVFVTNAVMGIMPVLEINDKSLGCGRPGEITSRLIKSYKVLIRRQIVKSLSA